MKIITNISRCAAVLATLATFSSIHVTRAEAPAGETDLIAILKSDAPPGEKGIACKKLAVWGTREAVPALAPLLADPQLSSWARIGLQNIPGPEAGAALRDAMGTLQGRLLVGVINSISERRDVPAVPGLITKLNDADAGVASAAAVALGNIGGDDAVKALQPLLASAPEAVRPSVAEGLILAAEHQLAAAKFAEAARVYDAVRAAAVPKQKALEATRGAILARRTDGVPLLAEQLRSGDRAFFNIGLQVARELPGPEATRLLLTELEKASPENQPYLLLALADRGGPDVLPAAMASARATQPGLRIAAIDVLESLAQPAAIPVLLEAAAAEDAAVAKSAKAAVSHLQGPEVETALVGMLKKSDDKARLAAIEIVALRRTPGAIPAMLVAADDANKEIGAASLKVLGDVAGASEVAPLLKLLAKNPQQPAVERALAATIVRSARPTSGTVVIQRALYGDLPDGEKANVTKKVKDLVNQGTFTIEASNAKFGDPAGGRVKKLRVDYTVNGIAVSKTINENDTLTLAVNAAPPEVVDPLCAAMADAPAAAKPAVLRLLRLAGGPKALAAVRAATGGADAELKETALRTLCDWPSTDALPDLAQLARSAGEEKFRLLALRGQIRLIAQQAIDPGEKTAALKDVMPQVQRTEEKRLVLAALTDIPTAGSLALVAGYIGQDDVKDDAGSAAVAIATPLAKKHPAEVIAALEPVTKSANADLAQRATQVLNQAKAASRK